MNRTPVLVAVGAIVAIILAGGSFVAGRTVGTNEAQASASASIGRQGRGQGQGQGQVQFGGAGTAGRALSGQILAVGDGTITIQLSQDPAAQGSRIVLVAPSTRVVKTTETDVKLADLKAGDRVTVVGQENADGTVSATAVIDGQNALQNLFGGAGGARPSATPSPTR